ncbi:MAG: CpaD family pilus assembly lipoprotein [Rhodospirillales bacterium]|nr:CpaD family pilus assembly lipoprotein [Rhodospirillales bacterium]
MSAPLLPARPGQGGGLLAAPAAILLAAVALAGCAAMSDAAHDVGLPVQDFSDVVVAREPRPELVAFSHEVRFAGAREDLDAAEADRLRAFLARAGSRYGGDDVFVVTAPAETAPTRPGPAAALAVRRGMAVKAFLARERIAASVVQIPPEPGRRGDLVAVSVRRYVAVLPPCPDWSGVPGVNFNNQPASNWSCATAVNFGMMLANPADLVRGRDPGYADGERAARTVKAYREGKTKPIIRDASAAEVFPDAGGPAQ